MKKIYTLFVALIITGCLMAQTPQSFKYQAVARDASGNVLVGQAVGMQISILQGSISGAAVYVETFAPTTNDFGLINLDIGNIGNIGANIKFDPFICFPVAMIQSLKSSCINVHW